jgi:hypothetical protein
MGSMIGADDFLCDAILTRTRGYETMARLARMQIVTGNRTQHILHLNTEHLRAEITKYARIHQIPAVPVPCSRCRCEAYLEDWLKASEYTKARCEKVHRLLLPDNRTWRLAFMVQCRGMRLAGGTMAMCDAVLAGRW